MKQVLSELPKQFVANDQAINVISENKGLLPIEVNSNDSGKVTWLDFDRHKIIESKFSKSIENRIAETPQPKLIETNIDLLSRDNILSDSIYPTGFVFFVHRCGSTLLGKALAQVDSHIVMNEANALHEGLWSYLSKGWTTPISPTDENLSIIRNLILALGRRRTDKHNSYFIKFNPWHSVSSCMDIITAAFPDVPCLFLYRDVNEMLASVSKVSAPIMSNIIGTKFAAFLTDISQEQTNEMGYMDYFARLYRQLMLGAINYPADNISYLNYKHLTASNFEFILNKSFNFSVGEDLAIMKKQFGYYSKNDSNTERFSCDKAEKQKMVNADMTEAVNKNGLLTLYSELESSEKNLFKA